MWLDLQNPTIMSHLANCIVLAQLIATLIHYPCTVVLMGLVNWSAFLELVLPTMWSHDWDNGTHGGHHMGGMHGSDIHLISEASPKALQACLVLWLVVLRLIATPNSPIGSLNPPLASHPPPSPTPPPYTYNLWYYSGCEKSCSKSCSVSQLLLMVMKH